MQSKGIAHRDLKPENILISKIDKPGNGFSDQYDLKIADYGLAKFVNEM